MHRFSLVPFILFLGALSASGQNLITVTGTSAGTDNEEATAQSSWTQTTTYTGVTIQATIEKLLRYRNRLSLFDVERNGRRQPGCRKQYALG